MSDKSLTRPNPSEPPTDDLMRKLRQEGKQPTPEEIQTLEGQIERSKAVVANRSEDDPSEGVLLHMSQNRYFTPRVAGGLTTNVSALLVTAIDRTNEYARTLPRMIDARSQFSSWTVIRAWIETVAVLCAVSRKPDPNNLAAEILDPDRQQDSSARFLKSCRNMSYPKPLDLGNTKNVPIGGLKHMWMFTKPFMKAVNSIDHFDYGAVDLAVRPVLYENKVIGYEPGRQDVAHRLILHDMGLILGVETWAHMHLLAKTGLLVY